MRCLRNDQPIAPKVTPTTLTIRLYDQMGSESVEPVYAYATSAPNQGTKRLRALLNVGIATLAEPSVTYMPVLMNHPSDISNAATNSLGKIHG